MITTNYSEFLIKDGILTGINLGDICDDETISIEGIKNSFGVKDNIATFGIEKRNITKIPDNLIFKELKIKHKKYFVILYTDLKDIDTNEENYKEWLPKSLIPCKTWNMVSAWDTNSFGILVTEKYRNEIDILYKAFINKDISLGIFPYPVACWQSGLVFSITSKIQKEHLDEIYKMDKKEYDLRINTGYKNHKK